MKFCKCEEAVVVRIVVPSGVLNISVYKAHLDISNVPLCTSKVVNLLMGRINT